MTNVQAQTLTHRQIDEMSEGYEIDKLVMMIITTSPLGRIASPSESNYLIPLLIIELARLWPTLSIEHNGGYKAEAYKAEGGDCPEWTVASFDGIRNERMNDNEFVLAHGKTLQLALCRALLKASNPK